MKEEGKTRHDLGREKFVEKVWEWKEQYGGKITTQLRKLGVSTDWSRQAFTMDEVCCCPSLRCVEPHSCRQGGLRPAL